MRIVSLLSLLLSCTLFAGEKSGIAGFEFLSVQAGAMPVSLGGAYTAGFGDVYSIAANPAGLSGLRTRTFAFDYLHYVLDIQRGMVAFASPLNKKSKDGIALGGYINYLNAGAFEYANVQGETGGSFTAGSFEAGFTAAAKTDFAFLMGRPVNIGATIKGIREQVEVESWSALAVDAGIQVLSANGRIRLGASARNLGLTLSSTDSFPLPSAYSFGLSYASKAWQNTRFYSDFQIPSYGDKLLKTGLDLRIEKDIYIRLGYRFIWAEIVHWYNSLSGSAADESFERTDFNTWSAGIGFRLIRSTNIDLAVQGNRFQNIPLLSATVQYVWR